MKKEVLDKGSIEIFSLSSPFISYDQLNYTMGPSDIIPVNTARVSYGAQIDQMREKDIKLLNYLKEHGHTSPFRHIYIGFRVKAPEFVGRQWWKHTVGSEYTFKDNPWNEISGRYVTIENEFYVPNEFGKQPDVKHQGGIENLSETHQKIVKEKYKRYLEAVNNLYNDFINSGMSKEHARLVLPISFYTQFVWTASLQAIKHFIDLRDKTSAQWEIQQYAIAMRELVNEILPNVGPIFLDEKG